MEPKKGQISVEYLVIIGFVTIVVIGILGIALVYSGAIKDKIKISQVTSFANKIISTSESVFYAGAPSKSTISVYLPENVEEILIIEDSLIISIQTSTGKNRISFSSKVPISGNLGISSGLKKIKIEAGSERVDITPA
ncbi:MAG: hypothetical protein ABIH28_03865 [archaeon]